MTIKIYDELEQGSDEWLSARCGLLTASEMKLIITPTGKVASNDKERAHLYELLAQRITRYVEPHYISDDMLRGHEDEVDAKIIYNERYAAVREVGFITNDKWGFTLGYSPDGLIGADGAIECKGRRQKFQVETIIGGEVPADYLIQIQTGLLVSERRWCDFISYSGGLPMVTIRVHTDPVLQDQIVTAATEFERRLTLRMEQFGNQVKTLRVAPTERRVEQEILV